MRTLLANPPWYDEKKNDCWGIRAGSRWPHMARRPNDGALPRYLPFPFFLAIAAAELVRRGHEVELIDGVAEGLTRSEFIERVAQFNPEFIFTESSTPSFNYDLTLLREIGKQFPKAVLASGGSHEATLARKAIKEAALSIHWIQGEYEKALPDLVETIETNDPSRTRAILAARHVIDDVDSLPKPLFEKLPMGEYRDPVCGLPTPNGHSWLSRGCPFTCSFCVWPQIIFGNRKYRQRNIDQALDEVESLINDYGCESFYFDDDTANIGEERMEQLAQKIISRGLNKYPWAMMARADCMSSAMIANLAAAGLYAVKYGVESVSARLINACDKKTDLPKFLNAIEATRKNNVKMHLTFTFGIPGETVDTMRETLRFAIETAPESAQFSYCTPFPGTRYYDECQRNGWLATEDWKHFLGEDDPVISTPWLSAEELKKTYIEIMSEWRDFLDDRMNRRKKRLTDCLEKETAYGARWKFFGDKKFADFLWEKKQLPAPVDGNQPVDLVVIVSRHDEEKIYRRLLRDGQLENKKVFRIFNES